VSKKKARTEQAHLKADEKGNTTGFPRSQELEETLATWQDNERIGEDAGQVWPTAELELKKKVREKRHDRSKAQKKNTYEDESRYNRGKTKVLRGGMDCKTREQKSYGRENPQQNPIHPRQHALKSQRGPGRESGLQKEMEAIRKSRRRRRCQLVKSGGEIVLSDLHTQTFSIG